MKRWIAFVWMMMAIPAAHAVGILNYPPAPATLVNPHVTGILTVSGSSVLSTTSVTGGLTTDTLTANGQTILGSSTKFNGSLASGGLTLRNGSTDVIKWSLSGGGSAILWDYFGATSSNAYVFQSGSSNVGIAIFPTLKSVAVGGGASPAATIHVQDKGTVLFTPQGSAPYTCNSTLKGGVAMTSSTSVLCFCNGSSWLYVSTGLACTW